MSGTVDVVTDRDSPPQLRAAEQKQRKDRSDVEYPRNGETIPGALAATVVQHGGLGFIHDRT